MASMEDLPHLEITSRQQWRDWLAAHHGQDTGIWLVTYKKHCGERHVPWPDVVREALCFGWIDSRTRRVDEERMKVLVSPRQPGSVWSAVNKRLVAELEEAGLMQPAGARLVAQARKDGSWSFLDDVEALAVPDDLGAALDAGAARAAWDGARDSVKKRALYHLKTAKQARTREKRIQEMVERLQQGRPPVGPD